MVIVSEGRSLEAKDTDSYVKLIMLKSDKLVRGMQKSLVSLRVLDSYISMVYRASLSFLSLVSPVIPLEIR